jgi:outer membrane protein assembly factor BamB
VWRIERPTDAPRESPDAYTTPLLVEQNGRQLVVISGADYVTAHDPETGKEVWRMGGLNPRSAGNYRIVASPVFASGRIFAPTRVKPLLAIDLDDEDIAAPPSLAWQWELPGSPDVPTPAADGDRLFMINDDGIVTCIDAATGEPIWGPERTVRGTVSSSPLLADGKLYFTNEEAVTVVVDATGDTFRMIAANELDGSYTLSSPVAAGRDIFIRTATHLYCIGTD